MVDTLGPILKYGPLAFLGGGYTAYRPPYKPLSEGFDPGSAEPLLTALPRLLFDGEIVTRVRNTNRVLTFPLLLQAAPGDLKALNELEAELTEQLEKARNEIEWKPQGLGPSTIYETFVGHAVQRYPQGWDAREYEQGQRLLEVSMPAGPWARSKNATVVSGIEVTGTQTTTQVDDCDLITGWTGRLRDMSIDTVTKFEGTGSLKSQSEADGAYLFELNPDGVTATITYQGFFEKTLGAPVDTSVEKYLSCVTIPYANQQVTAYADGEPLVLAGTTNEPGGAWRRYWFRVAADEFTDLSIRTIGSEVVNKNTPPARMSQQIDDIRVHNHPPASTSGRAGLLSVPIGGSVRTPGSIHIEHPTAALGTLVVHTSEDLQKGFRPDNRVYRVSGQTVNTDTDRVSGASEALHTTAANSFTAEVPIETLTPGAYWAKAILSRDLVGTERITLTAQTKFGTTLDPLVEPIYADIDFADDDRYYLKDIGVIYLPPMTAPAGSGAKVQLVVTKSTATDTWIDDLLLFPLAGTTTQIDCGTGTPAAGGDSSHVWINAPALDCPDGELWMGPDEDKVNARFAGPHLGAYGEHVLAPGAGLVYVLAPNAPGFTMEVSHFHRWPNNAAD